MKNLQSATSPTVRIACRINSEPTARAEVLNLGAMLVMVASQADYAKAYQAVMGRARALPVGQLVNRATGPSGQ